MGMKAWVISDTHFNHENIIKYCNRPSDYEMRILDALNRIKEDDLLIHLGDICIGQDEHVHSLLNDLKCRKVLVIGNHDSKSWSWYMEHGWDFVCDAFRLKYAGKIIMFSHAPQPWDGVWEVNVHGHLHNLGREKELKHPLKEWHRLYAPEEQNYQPIELANFIQRVNNHKSEGG